MFARTQRAEPRNEAERRTRRKAHYHRLVDGGQIAKVERSCAEWDRIVVCRDARWWQLTLAFEEGIELPRAGPPARLAPVVLFVWFLRPWRVSES